MFLNSNGVWEPRKYINDWTINPANNLQRRLNFIEFPDKPNANTKRWNYLVQVGGYLSHNIGVRTGDETK